MQVYTISDLGASFGTAGISRTHEISKGNIKSYSHSKFIKRLWMPTTVDFETSRPCRADGHGHLKSTPGGSTWNGLAETSLAPTRNGWAELLAELSPQQIRDAFRAAGYSAEETEEFAGVLEERIGESTKL